MIIKLLNKFFSLIIFFIFNPFFKSFFFIFCIIKIIFKIKYIREFNKIIIFDNVGFGHSITLLDGIRYFENEKILVIKFFQNKRHNPYIHLIYNAEIIYFATSLKLIVFNKTLSLGSFKSTEKSSIKKLIIIFIKKVVKNNSTIINIRDYYNYIGKKYKKKLDIIPTYHQYDYMNIYFHTVKNNLELKKLNLDLIEKKVDKNFLDIIKNKKIVTFYFRQKGEKSNIESYYRSGSAPNEYYETFEYLKNKNYIICVTGDNLFDKNYLKINKKYIYDFISAKTNFYIFNIYVSNICKYFVSEPGGAQYFGLHITNHIMINQFPFGHYLPKTHILYKNIIEKNTNKYLDHGLLKKLYKYNYNLNKNHKLLNNTSKEILNHLKRVI